MVLEVQEIPVSYLYSYYSILHLFWIMTISNIDNEITLSKKTFVNVHNADNIRDDYLIGKVLGSGK